MTGSATQQRLLRKRRRERAARRKSSAVRAMSRALSSSPPPFPAFNLGFVIPTFRPPHVDLEPLPEPQTAEIASYREPPRVVTLSPEPSPAPKRRPWWQKLLIRLGF